MGTTYLGFAFRNAMKGGEHGKARRQGRSGDGRGIGAARRVKVNSNKRRGSAPPRISRATRCASVLVLPVPAPAAINRWHRPLFRTDAKGSGAALRRVQPIEKRVNGGRRAGSVPFLFHRNRIPLRVRPRKSRQVSTGSSVRARYHRPWVRPVIVAKEVRFVQELSAGGRWIRTIGPRHERAGFCCGSCPFRRDRGFADSTLEGSGFEL